MQWWRPHQSAFLASQSSRRNNVASSSSCGLGMHGEDDGWIQVNSSSLVLHHSSLRHVAHRSRSNSTTAPEAHWLRFDVWIHTEPQRRQKQKAQLNHLKHTPPSLPTFLPPSLLPHADVYIACRYLSSRPRSSTTPSCASGAHLTPSSRFHRRDRISRLCTRRAPRSTRSRLARCELQRLMHRSRDALDDTQARCLRSCGMASWRVHCPPRPATISAHCSVWLRELLPAFSHLCQADCPPLARHRRFGYSAPLCTLSPPAS